MFVILYLSIIGIETKKFNQQIKDKVTQSNKNLNIDLNKVKLTLDPLKFTVNAKTIGATIYYLHRPLELEYIQTNVSIDSIFKNKLVSSNFKIASRSILLKDLIKFTRSITFKPELLILETMIKDGHVILNLNLNLDKEGKIKNDYEIKGKLKEGKIKFIKNINFEKVEFLFNLKEKKYTFKDIKFSSDKVNFNSDLLKIIKINDNYQIEGELENSKSNLSKNFIKLFNLNFKNFDIKNTKFSSKNNFVFHFNKKFKFENLKVESQINFNQILYKNKNNLSDYFPDLKNDFLLKNHDLKLKYEKKILSVNGKGQIKIGNNSEKVEYVIGKVNNDFEFESNLKIGKTTIKNQKLFTTYFPKTKDLIDLKDHNLNIKYKDKKLFLSGQGGIRLEKGFDMIKYLIIKNKDDFELEADLNLKKITLKNQKILENNFPLIKDLIDLQSNKLNIKFKENELFLTGESEISLENEFSKIKYSLSKNKDDFNVKTEIELKNISLKNNKISKNFFPSAQDLLSLKDHKIKINYQKDLVSFSGKGKIKIDKYYDEINYFISKEFDEINFDLNSNLDKTNFQIQDINYKKNNNFRTKINLSGSFRSKKKLILNNLSINDKKNKIEFNNLVFDKDNLIIKLDKAHFDYIDTDEKNNQFIIIRDQNNDYKLNGLFFNANTIVTNLLKSGENKENNFLKNNINITLNLNEVYLDEINFIKNLQGLVFIKDNKVVDANLLANFDHKSNITFTIKTKDNQKITKLFSSKAKPLVDRYKFIKGFNEGYLDFVSEKKDGKSISNLKIYNFKLKELPTLTKLLSLASLQGIADILTGEGIRFDEFEMNFINEGKLMTINEIYAIGPAISILMNGYVEKDNLISLRGTLVPATTINKTISKIPVLGKILVGKKTGEGVFGVSFKIKGPPKDLETTVNPIKTLTPRFITRTLDKLKNN